MVFLSLESKTNKCTWIVGAVDLPLLNKNYGKNCEQIKQAKSTSLKLIRDREQILYEIQRLGTYYKKGYCVNEKAWKL